MNAYIDNGVVFAIADANPGVLGTSEIQEIALAGRTDIPQIGYIYNAKADIFTAPEVACIVTTLDEARCAAINTINSIVSHVRKSYLGDLTDQFSIYTAKFQEAKAYKLSLFGTDLTCYPWIKAEMSATGCTVDEAVSRFDTNYTAMIEAFTKVEEIRIFYKAQIMISKDMNGVRESKVEAIQELNKLVSK